MSSHFQKIVDHEFATGRYIGPFTCCEIEQLLGPFQTSPLSLIPKPYKPSVFRLIQNFSFPYTSSPSHTSINSYIHSDDFPCTWGTFPIFSFLVSNLPPGSQAAVRDVSEAYRTIPLHPSQWPGTVVRISNNDSFAIDTQGAFGTGSAPGTYGNLQDGGVDIMRHSGLGPISKWVDDHVFFRLLRDHLQHYNQKRAEWHQQITGKGGRQHAGGRVWFEGINLPTDQPAEFDEDMAFPIRDLSAQSPRSLADQAYTCNLADIDAVSARLGIPWQTEKDIPFSPIFPFTGFTWDLETKRVSLAPSKKDKYLLALKTWQRTRLHDLLEVQKLHGKLQHASLVVPAGRAYLTNLEAMLGIFGDAPFKPRTPPRRTPEDIAWWLRTLSAPNVSRPVPGLHPILDLGAFSDASSGVGIAVIVGNRWRAWTLKVGWRDDQRDIGWAEALGFEFLVRTLLTLRPASHAAQHLRVYGDNQGVVEGWRNGKSRNHQVNLIFRRIHDLLAPDEVSIHPRYIPSEHNPADRPSWGIYPPAYLLLPPIDVPNDA